MSKQIETYLKKLHGEMYFRLMLGLDGVEVVLLVVVFVNHVPNCHLIG